MAEPSEENTQRDAAAGHVGALLQASRQRLGEDLPEVAQMLRIRLPYLAAIEAGRYRDLPGATYAVGFIRAYADHLGLDSDEVVRRFKAETIDGGADQKLSFPTPVPETGIPGGAYVFIGLVVAVLAYGLWYVSTTEDGFLAELINPLDEQLTGLLSEDEADTADAADGAEDTRPDGSQQTDAALSGVTEGETVPPVVTPKVGGSSQSQTAQTEQTEQRAQAEQAVADAPSEQVTDASPVLAEQEPAPQPTSEAQSETAAVTQSEAPAGAAGETVPDTEPTSDPTSEPAAAAEPSPEPVAAPAPSPAIASDAPVEAAAQTGSPQEPETATGPVVAQSPQTVAAAPEPAAPAPAVPAPAEPAVTPEPVNTVAEAPSETVAEAEQAAAVIAAGIDAAPPEEPAAAPPEESAAATVDEAAEPEPVVAGDAPDIISETEPAPFIASTGTESEIAAPEPPAVPVREAQSEAEVAAVTPAEAPAESASRIVINARNNSWIQVRDDLANQMLVTRLLTAGDSYEVPNRPGLVLLTGNAGALEIVVDGATVPSIGGNGVVRRGVLLEAERLKNGTAVTN